MTINQFDLELEAGASWSYTWTWTDPSTTLPIDLTGFTAKGQIRWMFGDPVVQLELNTTNGGVVLGGEDGTVTLNITSAQTTTLSNDLFRTRGIYDLFLTDPSTSPSTVTKFLDGFVYIDTPVTIIP